MSNLVILFGISGSGKTELGKSLEGVGYKKIITHTTREKREGEVDGVDYHFVNEEDFKALDKVEFTKYAGNFYGTATETINKALNSPYPHYIIMDCEGVIAMKNLYRESVTSIEIRTPINKIKERMVNRGDKLEEINLRIQQSEEEMAKNERLSDFVVNNDDSLEGARKSLLMILNTYSLKRLSFGDSDSFFENSEVRYQNNTYSLLLGDDFVCKISGFPLNTYEIRRVGTSISDEKDLALKRIVPNNENHYVEAILSDGEVLKRAMRVTTDETAFLIREAFDKNGELISVQIREM